MKKQTGFSFKKLYTFGNRRLTVIVLVVVFAIIGVIAIALSRAGTASVSIEAEAGNLGGAAALANDQNASGGKAVQFKAGTTTPPTGGSTDAFGVKQIYPSLGGGKNWVSNWNIARTIGFGQDPNDPWVFGRGDAEYKATGDGTLTISGGVPRYYINSPDKAQWRNVEITMYFNMKNKPGQPWGGMVAVARSNHLSDTALCDTRGYGNRFRTDGNIDYEKEIRHNDGTAENYAIASSKKVPQWNASLNKWYGFKYVVYDTPDGNVKLESYIDLTDGANGGTWEKVNEFTDTGTNLGSGLACKAGINPALKLDGSGSRDGSESGKPNLSVYFRSDLVGQNGLIYKKGSVREITP
jgi:hypothetical protein